MTDPSAHSSELQWSRQLSQRLMERSLGAASTSPDDGMVGRYAVFSAAKLVPPAPPAAPPRSVSAPPAEEPPAEEPPRYTVNVEGFDSWDELLSWCADVGQARSVLVVGTDGFVIAYHGDEPTDGIEGLGANLSAVVHHMDGCGGGTPVGWFAIELPNRWLVGLQVATSSDNTFVFAMICPEPLAAAGRTAMARQIQYSMRHLD